ncbi:single-stranded DNA-binding protein [Lactobacillus crispatus]|jgi:single-strand binding protein|uniref:single-stranded DNA-binding protein n=1 Tax=Lactobacillus crispatus TaxID=47770 RepID=UPI001F09B6A4|nr:single-stranded DNA-binding protein [Lactobacillus crispatus]
MINQVVIDGYIGKELELKTTQSLKKYVAFTICQNRYSKIQQDCIGEWHHVIAWNKVAENLVAKAHKGLKVVLAGEQRTRNFIDKNGNKVAYEYIWVNSFDILTNHNEEPPKTIPQNLNRADDEEPEVDRTIVEANEKDKLAEEPFGSQKEVQLTDADLPF